MLVGLNYQTLQNVVLKIGDGYRLRAWRNHYKFYDDPFLFRSEERRVGKECA